ncbi:MAG: hypothetical protein GY715_20365 [Planctomycetes bacterium]|nr:hypothetical protein [Planctomycetota bacterium]
MHALIISSSIVMGVALATSAVHGQSFALDDNPSAPVMGPVGPIPGYGAENPYGLPGASFPPGLAPSPTLAAMPCFDSDMLKPGPVIDSLCTNGDYEDSVSGNAWGLMPNPNRWVRFRFSVDRLSVGKLNTAVYMQWTRNQQPGDIFFSSDWFAIPESYPGTMPATGGYGGPLVPMPHLGSPFPPSNMLLYDDSFLGLTCAGAIVPPNVTAAPIGFGTHDNVDQYDHQPFDLDGDQNNDVWEYFTVYPDEAQAVGESATSIFDVAPGAQPVWPRQPYAQWWTMGVDYDLDSIDALIVYDLGPVGGPEFGGPGAQPGIDFALFSLAPGSTSLAQYGLSAADVFFTDYRGTFWLFATASQLGLDRQPGGEPEVGDNVDALEVMPWCYADLDTSGDVGFGDILTVIGSWGPCPPPPNPCPADINGNGQVDFADIFAIIANWGPCA